MKRKLITISRTLIMILVFTNLSCQIEQTLGVDINAKETHKQDVQRTESKPSSDGAEDYLRLFDDAEEYLSKRDIKWPENVFLNGITASADKQNNLIACYFQYPDRMEIGDVLIGTKGGVFGQHIVIRKIKDNIGICSVATKSDRSFYVQGVRVSRITKEDMHGHASLLHYFIESGRMEEALLLVRAGVDVNSKGEDGITPLHQAVRKGKMNLVIVLLEAGADVKVEDYFKRSPLKLAYGIGATAIAEEINKYYK